MAVSNREPPPGSCTDVLCRISLHPKRLVLLYESPAPAVRTLALTAESRRSLAELAASASQGKVPKPPPGYKTNRTQGFPLANLELLFGHVLNVLGPEISAAKPETIPVTTAADTEAPGSVGSKRARSPAGDEGGGKRRAGEANAAVKSDADNVSAMDVDASKDDGKPRAAQHGVGVRPRSEPEAEPEPEAPDPVKEGLEAAKKAFTRVLSVWEGVGTEGKRELHQKVVARLGRMLAEAEANARAEGVSTPEGEVGWLKLFVMCGD